MRQYIQQQQFQNSQNMVSNMNDFQIIKKLGSGAYSSVFLVKRLKDSQTYAMKKVKLNNISEQDRRNALNEVRILASINHPNIVAYKDCFIDENKNTLNIVMEYCDDGDLYQKIQLKKQFKQCFDEQFIWGLFGQIVQGLNQLHKMGIYHRDMKSANIMLTKSGEFKLADLNVSKVVENNKKVYTQTGTPYYASPEVWKDKPYDDKSDIWSLGIIIYEMMHGEPPFKSESMEGLYMKVIKGNFQLRNNFSQNLNDVIKGLLQIDSIQRPTCQEIINSQIFSDMCRQSIGQKVQSEGDNVLLKTINFNKQGVTDRNRNYQFPQSKYQSNNSFEQVQSLSKSNQNYNQKYDFSTNSNNNYNNILNNQYGNKYNSLSEHHKISNQQAYLNNNNQQMINKNYSQNNIQYNIQSNIYNRQGSNNNYQMNSPNNPNANNPSNNNNNYQMNGNSRDSYINQMMQRQHHNIISNDLNRMNQMDRKGQLMECQDLYQHQAMQLRNNYRQKSYVGQVLM